MVTTSAHMGPILEWGLNDRYKQPGGCEREPALGGTDRGPCKYTTGQEGTDGPTDPRGKGGKGHGAHRTPWACEDGSWDERPGRDHVAGEQPGGLASVDLSEPQGPYSEGGGKRQGGSGRWEEALRSAVVEEGAPCTGTGTPLRRQTQDRVGLFGDVKDVPEIPRDTVVVLLPDLELLTGAGWGTMALTGLLTFPGARLSVASWETLLCSSPASPFFFACSWI